MKIARTALLCATIGLLSGCTATTEWNATNHVDEFTKRKICRVEYGTPAGRSFARSATGRYFTQIFYAENHNGEVRTGVRSEPLIPISGDIQILVGDNLYTITAADTPIDIAPNVNTAGQEALGKEYAETLENLTKGIQQSTSPYRAYTGSKAQALLRDIVDFQGEVKFRGVGVNVATSTTASFTADASFIAALQACGINY